jgi:hypothetical protein
LGSCKKTSQHPNVNVFGNKADQKVADLAATAERVSHIHTTCTTKRNEVIQQFHQVM